MKQSRRLLIAVGFVANLALGGVGSMSAYTRAIRSLEEFDKVIAKSPMSVVVFWRKSEGPKGLEKEVGFISRDKRYKEANLKFWLIDLDRTNLSILEQRYRLTQLPMVQLFLRTQPKRNAFLYGCFNQEQLRRFIERYLARALTTEIHRKQIKRQLAQAPRDYYAADYYNPFYMMPWTNYTPPSDWPDQGPEWVGIEID
jgi:hypothetical protein